MRTNQAAMSTSRMMLHSTLALPRRCLIPASIRATARVPTVLARSKVSYGGDGVARGDGIAALAMRTIEDIKREGTFKEERIISSPQSTEIRVDLPQGDGTQASKNVLNFCSNNYLGLSNDPRIVAAAHAALDERGFGLSSVRFICGTQDRHRELERLIADFHGMDDAILYPSCFDANAGLFETLLGPEDAVVSDELNHASLIDGIRLCKAQRYRYRHSDMQHMDEVLSEASASARNVLIVSDGVFSMDGDVAKLGEMTELAEKYSAQVLLDECHATGFFGRSGRGSPEHCGVDGRIDIINSTLGKALGGGTGGYTVGSQPIVDLLRQRSRPYLFSNSLAPCVVGAGIEAFKILGSSTEKLDKLKANVRLFRDEMSDAGFVLGGDSDNAIVPIMIGDARLATDISNAMLDRGIYVIGFSYPVVPKGKARIRVQLSAAHSTEEVKKAIHAFIEVGKLEGLVDRKLVE